MGSAELGAGAGGASSPGASSPGQPARARVEAQACPWRAGARGRRQVGPRDRTPPPAPSRLVRGRPAPALLPSRSAIGGRACRSEGAGPLCSADLPAAAAAAAAVLLAARAGRSAKTARGWRWEAARPRTQAVAKFPRRAFRGARLPATRDRPEKGSEIFNLEKNSTSFPLSSSLSGWPAAGAPNLGTAAPLPADRSLESLGTQVLGRPAARGVLGGVSAGESRARVEEGPLGALYGGGSPEWCAPGRPKLWCPLV